MAFCVINDNEGPETKRLADGINEAVKKNDEGALNKMLSEVNKPGMACPGAYEVQAALSPEARKATMVEDHKGGPGSGGSVLEISPIWKKDHAQK